MEPTCTTLATLKDLTEILKNLAQVAAFAAAGFGILKWVWERRDRSADMLLKLEERFDKPEIEKGRRLIEAHDGKTEFTEDEMNALDPLLRFYVILYNVHTAGQLGPTPYRYWIGCAHKDAGDRYNPVLRAYIDRYYTLLSGWLAKESFRPR